MNASERLSAGLKALPNKNSSFASTQAAWRFYGNEAISLQVLQEPLTAIFRKSCVDTYALSGGEYSLLVLSTIRGVDQFWLIIR